MPKVWNFVYNYLDKCVLLADRSRLERGDWCDAQSQWWIDRTYQQEANLVVEVQHVAPFRVLLGWADAIV